MAQESSSFLKYSAAVLRKQKILLKKINPAGEALPGEKTYRRERTIW